MERSKPDMESNSPKLFSDEDWRRIAGANLLLDGEGENDEIAIAEIEQAAHVGDIEGERVRVVGYSQSEEDDSYCLRSVEGVADLISPMEIDPEIPAPFAIYTKEMAALCVRTSQNDYYFPLDKQAIVSIELLPDDSGIHRCVRKLRHYADKIEEVAGVGDIQDAESRRLLIDEMNGVLNEIPYDGGIQVKCQAYKVKIDGGENNIEDANPAALFGWLPSFTWRDDRPVLEMFDIKNRFATFCVDMKDVLDMASIDKEEIGVSIDLFETVFNDDFQETAWQLATDLSYVDESEFDEVSREYTQTLNDHLSEFSATRLYDVGTVGFTGFVLAPDATKNNELQYEFMDVSKACIDGVCFVRHHDKFYAAIEATIDDESGDFSKKVYVIPDRDKIIRLEGFDGEAEELKMAVNELHKIANFASEVVNDECFYKLPLNEQLDVLSQYECAARNVIQDISRVREFKGECVVSAYRCLPGDLLNVVSWNDVPLEEVNSHEYVEEFALRADNLVVWSPEINDRPDIDGRILSVSELPLSRGEPVLIVNDAEENKYYLVRCSDVISLSRNDPSTIS
jgi:hypothetical protein